MVISLIAPVMVTTARSSTPCDTRSVPASPSNVSGVASRSRIAARAPSHVAKGTVDVTFAAAPRALDLKVGPLRPGGAQALIVDAAVPGVGNVVERLADDVELTAHEDCEYLRLRVAFPSE